MNLKLPQQNSTRIFQMLINVMPYIFWKDINGVYQGGNWNQAVNFGFSSPTEFIGKTIFQILEDQAAAQKIDDIDNQVMREKKLLRVEEKFKNAKGDRFFISQKQPILNSNGDVIGMLGFAIDITDFENEKQALLKEKEKTIQSNLEKISTINSKVTSLINLVKSSDKVDQSQRDLILNTLDSIAKLISENSIR
ncbi:MAG TPA: PAS domain-containing protein [Burkholderiales bacterium]|nr:PAS domain-containing protein [Burkholderiales bacterium]